MTAWSQFWCRRSSGRFVTLSLVAVLVCNAIMAYFVAALEAVAPGVGIPDVLLFVGSDELFARLDQLGPAGRAAYQPIAIADMVYPLAYGSFVLLALGWGLADCIEQRRVLQLLLLLPLVGVLADYAENVSTYAVLSVWPERSAAGATTWVYAHNLKWLCLMPSLFAALVASIRGLIRARAARSSAS